MKTIKNASSLVAAMMILVSAAHARTEKPVKTDNLSNLLIQGENRLRVTAPTISTLWEADVYRDLPNLIRDESLVGSLKTPTVNEPPVTFSAKQASEKTAAPWLLSIREAPILTVASKPGKDNMKVEWVFLVKDSQGISFYEERKKGRLPDQIIWDGVGKGGKALHVGDDYAYSLSIIDEAGNPQRFSGKPFSITGFRYKKSGGLVTALTPASLFTNDSSARISQEGMKLLAEVRDALRNEFGRKLEIVTYDTDDKFALARSNAVAKYLVSALEYAEERVEAKNGLMDKGKGYRHVEIIAK